jgi:hypothetical protein
MPTYKIVRFHQNKDNETVTRGLTLEQAQAHCKREDTHGDGWFDGYDEERDPQDWAREICLNEARLYETATDAPAALESEFRHYVARHNLDIDPDRVDFTALIAQIFED